MVSVHLGVSSAPRYVTSVSRRLGCLSIDASVAALKAKGVIANVSGLLGFKGLRRARPASKGRLRALWRRGRRGTRALVLSGTRRAGHAGRPVRSGRAACLPADPPAAGRAGARTGPGAGGVRRHVHRHGQQPARDRRERPQRWQARAGHVGGVPRPRQGLCRGNPDGRSSGTRGRAGAQCLARRRAGRGGRVRWPAVVSAQAAASRHAVACDRWHRGRHDSCQRRRQSR